MYFILAFTFKMLLRSKQSTNKCRKQVSKKVTYMRAISLSLVPSYGLTECSALNVCVSLSCSSPVPISASKPFVQTHLKRD
jgi:hypothetical protein